MGREGESRVMIGLHLLRQGVPRRKRLSEKLARLGQGDATGRDGDDPSRDAHRADRITQRGEIHSPLVGQFDAECKIELPALLHLGRRGGANRGRFRG